MSFEKWLSRQSLTINVTLLAGFLMLFFAAGAGDWWIAQEIPWWAFGLLSLIVTLTITSIRVYRKLRHMPVTAARPSEFSSLTDD